MSIKRILDRRFTGNRDFFFPHRLDKWTSGLLVVAFDAITSSKIAESMRTGTKKYRVLSQLTPCRFSMHVPHPPKACALVHRRMSPLAAMIDGRVKLRPKGSLDSFLGAWSAAKYQPYVPRVCFHLQAPSSFLTRSGSTCEKCARIVAHKSRHPFVEERVLHRTHTPNTPNAKEAHSKFTLKDYSLTRGVALYEAELLTGRTHQLRIQFSDAGAPIIADPYYNPMFVEFLQSGAAASEAPLGIASPLEMGLQAHALRFSHPHQPAQLINLRLPIPQKWKTIVSEVKTKSN